MKFLAFIFSILFTVQAFAGKCPFCREDIIQKQLVYEDTDTVVLYCLTPATEGNILVIPKRHIESFSDLTNQEFLQVKSCIDKAAKAFKEAYGIEDYVIIEKNGVLGGQTVAHIHFHVIPAPVHFTKIVDKAFNYRAPITDLEMKEYSEKLQPYFN